MVSRTKPYALVHAPIATMKAMTTPKAANALEAEREKLEDERAWVLAKVRSKRAVMNEAKKKKGDTMHSGSLMDLLLRKTLRAICRES